MLKFFTFVVSFHGVYPLSTIIMWITYFTFPIGIKHHLKDFPIHRNHAKQSSENNVTQRNVEISQYKNALTVTFPYYFGISH